ncbi:hypothetical protein K469DRAFT_137122 [Zopfia rhizophila CBS 207.26]|uniref:Uncharacterized protein n=1 Tax=Zopfia rhizophila CBS 207.26 TaxID=1314779 RepID=A0A6A6EUD4_9PEZI|nr:hypothetical protein K469DRAFT_137122 [Zopfia rhizophila CBS 207.26]
MADSQISGGGKKDVPFVLYKGYMSEVSCFTVGNNLRSLRESGTTPTPSVLTRSSNLHLYTTKCPLTDIPKGSYRLVYTPSILPSGAWVLIFAAPLGSEFVWFFWPSGSSYPTKMEEYLTSLTASGALLSVSPMKIGDKRHRLLHAMVKLLPMPWCRIGGLMIWRWWLTPRPQVGCAGGVGWG